MWMGSEAKPGPASIREVISNDKVECVMVFSHPIGIKESNEAAVWAIGEVLRILPHFSPASHCGE